MLNYRDELDKMPSYDGVEKNYRIKVNANESTLNLPPLVEERVINRLAMLAFNRYPNEEYYSLVEQIAKNFSVNPAQNFAGCRKRARRFWFYRRRRVCEQCLPPPQRDWSRR